MVERTARELDLLEGLDENIASLLEEWKVCGAAVCVFHNASLLYAKGFGLRDPHQGLEVNKDTLFRLASNTKAFTAMSLCMLVDEGKLELDTPIKQYLPSFRVYDAYATERMTPRDLLTHRTGIPGHDWAFGGNPKLSRKERVELLHHLEPNYDLRTRLQYNNNMYMTAGYLVEHLSGIPWETFVQERILNPLGMKSTNFSALKSKNTGNYALQFYEKEGELGEYEVFGDDPEAFYPRSPAGSINSSLHDLTKWVQLLVNKGMYNHQRIISEKMLNEMLSPQMLDITPLPFPEAANLCGGMGWFTINYRSHRLAMHGGFFGSAIYLIPEQGIGVVYLPTIATILGDVIAYTIFDRLLELPALPWNERYVGKKAEWDEAARRTAEENRQKHPRIPNTQPSHPLEDYTGLYRHPAYGELRITLEDDTLVHGDDRILTHYHYDTFDVVSAKEGSLFKVTFHTDARGVVSSATAPMEPAVKDIVFSKVTAEPAQHP